MSDWFYDQKISRWETGLRGFHKMVQQLRTKEFGFIIINIITTDRRSTYWIFSFGWPKFLIMLCSKQGCSLAYLAILKYTAEGDVIGLVLYLDYGYKTGEQSLLTIYMYVYKNAGSKASIRFEWCHQRSKSEQHMDSICNGRRVIDFRYLTSFVIFVRLHFTFSFTHLGQIIDEHWNVLVDSAWHDVRVNAWWSSIRALYKKTWSGVKKKVI